MQNATPATFPRQDALFAQALQLQKKGEGTRAEEFYRSVLRVDNNHAAALNNLGIILKNKETYHAAAALFLRAQAIKPHDRNITLNYANCLLASGDAAIALDVYESLLQNNGNAELFLYRGIALRSLGRVSDAVFSFERALSLNGQCYEAAWERAVTLLLSGDNRQGWGGLENRWKLGNSEKPHFVQPAWTGSDPQGKTLLLYAEDSSRDTLSFLRFAAPLQKQGAKIILYCQPELVPLLKHAPHLDAVYSLYDPIEPFDYHAPLLSLPFLLGATAETIAMEAPYIYAPPAPLELPFLEEAAQTVKVGVCLDARNINVILPLLQVPHTHFYSLHPTTENNLLETAGVQGLITDISPFISSIEATAHMLENIDLLVTGDNTLAHLAGGMGIPVWLCVPEKAHWQWGTASNSTIWYPTFRLFRHDTYSNEVTASTEMVRKLKSLVGM